MISSINSTFFSFKGSFLSANFPLPRPDDFKGTKVQWSNKIGSNVPKNSFKI